MGYPGSKALWRRYPPLPSTEVATQARPSPVPAGFLPQRPQWAPTVTNGHQRFRGLQGRQPSGSCSWDDVGRRFGLWSRRFGSAPSGSRRAATGVRNDRGARSKTVENHDRRSCHRRPLTWHFLRVFPVLNTTQFLAGMPGADLARRKPGVQIPSPPPPTSQVRASPASSGWRSPHSGAALGPRTPMGGSSTSPWERLPKLSTVRPTLRLTGGQRPALLAAHGPC
jgi:hypothetical protein